MVGISDIGTLSYIPSLNPRDLLVGISVAAMLKLIVYSKGKNKKKYRQGKEYGSARWGESKDIAPYIDPKFENNVLITNTERLTMNSRPKNPKYARNKNVLVIGGSGSGKTRFYVKPNLMQMHSSYVVTDPKGTLVLECGKMLYENGYDIKILNTINFKKSMKYNPFAYLRSEKDILKLVQTIIANTKGDGEKAGEDFWVKAEKLYYTALIGYIYYEAPEEEKNFKTLLDMIDASEVREDDETYMNPIDRLFEALEKKDPSHFAVKQYKKYKLAAGKTAKSILISCGARLAPFDIRELRELMSEDELELDKIGDRKTALFVIISDTDDTFNFVVSIMYSQLFNLLCDKADDVETRFVNAVNSIIENKDEIISNLEMVLDKICNKKELSEEKEKLEKSLAEQVEKIQELIDMNSRVAQNQEKYKKEYDAMIKTYDETKFKYEQLEIESSQQAAKHQMIKDYINTLKKQNKPLTKFDGLMWGSLLESATIKDKDTIVFKFKDGTEING
ncbi:VirD4-like conjugal transfer protein, CD1115 family [Clostridioides difficile]|nr:type IV secretory system conjugative DNA transfer family protein [Clostridioides difficile]SJV27699.1 TRAG family protein [Clostridioides difficile]VFD94614.1 conjugative transfer protein Tn1549-like, CTn2-Orf5 [Clostridioides difficile]VFE27488.1 conjugative transfer protein Tn1549-like, CTn2-Orf5 [Clostridioides difficile]VFE39930.1 conjugative transfer protein Tn1549-like, CTn2-Orf5 [Clostridioides difficile]VFF98614.1 conjugative transfer protein Tn1549-like, CTn2-Orf5 [Clostridioides d